MVRLSLFSEKFPNQQKNANTTTAREALTSTDVCVCHCECAEEETGNIIPVNDKRTCHTAIPQRATSGQQKKKEEQDSILSNIVVNALAAFLHSHRDTKGLCLYPNFSSEQSCYEQQPAPLFLEEETRRDPVGDYLHHFRLQPPCRRFYSNHKFTPQPQRTTRRMGMMPRSRMVARPCRSLNNNNSHRIRKIRHHHKRNQHPHWIVPIRRRSVPHTNSNSQPKRTTLA